MHLVCTLLELRMYSSAPKPITSFEAKKWLELNFPSRGKVINIPSSHKRSFSSNPSFCGKIGHFGGKGKLFSRENYPSEGKFSPLRESSPNFPLEGKFCLKRCLGRVIAKKRFQQRQGIFWTREGSQLVVLPRPNTHSLRKPWAWTVSSWDPSTPLTQSWRV